MRERGRVFWRDVNIIARSGRDVTYLQRLESPERTVRDIGRSIVRAALDGGR